MTTTIDKAPGKVSTGTKHLAWIPISQMDISPRAQRKHDSAASMVKIDYIADNFDPDKFGVPVVNLRDDTYWVIDGAHRILALIKLGWIDQQVQCWLYRGLSEEEEAEEFLSLNDVKLVAGMEKFKKALIAKRPIETDIDRIVRAAGLRIGSGADSIGCVAALLKTYAHGPHVLSTTIQVLRDSFGYPGFTSKVTEATGLFVKVYENKVDPNLLVERLSSTAGGVNGVTGKAAQLKDKYGVTLTEATAAALVYIYNRNTPAKAKLNGWWSTFNGQ